MKNFHLNHYERAFGNWLIDNKVQYIAVDEQKRAALGRSNIKSFDYLLYPPADSIIVAEVKGRKFKGTSLEKLTGLECWVSTDDIEGLSKWQEIFGPTHQAAFIFAYHIVKPDFDPDGREIYEYKGRKYVFFCVKLDHYIKHIKQRSPKWKTVTIPAEKFRNNAVQMQNLF